MGVNKEEVDYKFMYNSKEHQDELGLDWYDYGARNYDATLGRFMSVDPLAEERECLSPYNFVQNNPIMRTDPTGMFELDGEYEITHDKNGKEVRRKVSNLGDDVGIDFNHHLDGDRKGQTEIVNTKNGFTNWIADSRFMKGYTQRDENTNWESVYDEWQSGTQPNQSTINQTYIWIDNNVED